MKKNKMMRIASSLLVLTLLTTCMISATFAKYTSSYNGSDTAQVAKWGVVATVSGSLYGTKYKSNVPTVEEVTTDKSFAVVSSNTNQEVVAPGTQSENGLMFSLTGQPEVRTEVTIDVSAQDIYLEAGTYAVMKKVTVNETTFDAFAKKLADDSLKDEDRLYTKNNNGEYVPVTGTKVTVEEEGSSTTTTPPEYDKEETYYQLFDEAVISSDYYPLTYTLADVGESQESETDTSEEDTGSPTKATEIAKEIAIRIDSKAKPVDSSDTNTETTESTDSSEVKTGDLQEVVESPTDDNGDTETTDTSVSGEFIRYNVSNTYKPNEKNFSDVIGTKCITWKWPFDVDKYHNSADTILGDLIATYAGESDDLVTAIDENADASDTSDTSDAPVVVLIDGDEVFVLSVDADGYVSYTSVAEASVRASGEEGDEEEVNETSTTQTTSKTIVGSVKTSFSIKITAEQVPTESVVDTEESNAN